MYNDDQMKATGEGVKQGMQDDAGLHATRLMMRYNGYCTFFVKVTFNPSRMMYFGKVLGLP
jgi:hypothetical protein